MLALIGKVEKDTERIRQDGTEHANGVSTNAALENTHLKALSDAVHADTFDADKAREEEMEDMKKEMELIRDANGALRQQLAHHWKTSEGDEAMMETLIQTRVYPGIAQQIRNPERIIDHHLFILRVQETAAAQEGEILQTARRHVQAILNEMNRTPFVPPTKQ
jgi:hypothetical protein